MHAEDGALDQREANPLIDVLHLKGAMLEEDDVGAVLGFVVDKSKKIER